MSSPTPIPIFEPEIADLIAFISDKTPTDGSDHDDTITLSIDQWTVLLGALSTNGARRAWYTKTLEESPVYKKFREAENAMRDIVEALVLSLHNDVPYVVRQAVEAAQKTISDIEITVLPEPIETIVVEVLPDDPSLAKEAMLLSLRRQLASLRRMRKGLDVMGRKQCNDAANNIHSSIKILEDRDEDYELTWDCAERNEEEGT